MAKTLNDHGEIRLVITPTVGVLDEERTYLMGQVFPHLMQLIESARLGGGERAEKLLGVHPVPVGTMAEVAMEGAALSFEEICFTAL